MRRSVWIFFAAILLPSLGLAWLAVRSVRDQQVILEHQQTIIDQGVTDELARDINEVMDQTRKDFIVAANSLLASGTSPLGVATDFDRRLRVVWPLAETGFAVDIHGGILSPIREEGDSARAFLDGNERFLSNRENAEIYSMNANAMPDFQSQSMSQMARIPRKITPQQIDNQAAFSNAVPAESDFRRAIAQDSDGALARFTDNKLRLMVWWRPPADPAIVLGAQLNQTSLVEKFRLVVQPLQKSASDGPAAGARFCLAILDDNGNPVALSMPDFTADWKHPFVATEIGGNLPHWEAALYLIDAGQIGRTARTLQLTLGLIVLVLLVAIVAGGTLIAADIRRQTLLARQKTDFVSNVSHELKTPLTSIRMFADLLAEDRVSDPDRRASYLRIIAAESARLSRLINNVLDFARLERGAPVGERQPCDLVEIAIEVMESSRPGMESAGASFTPETLVATLPVTGERDALAQILLNLISNAGKYGGNETTVRLRREETKSGPVACVDVLDRGPGVPAGQEEAVFAPFHRLADTLTSSSQGSGLGLTLARHAARAHGGDIICKPRDGGGCRFTFTMPLTA